MLAQAKAKKEELERQARAKKEELERQALAKVDEAKAKVGLSKGAGADADKAAAEPEAAVAAKRAEDEAAVAAAAASVAAGAASTAAGQLGRSPPQPAPAAPAAAAELGPAAAAPAAAETQTLVQPDPELSNLIAVKAKGVPTWVVVLWFGYGLHTAIMHFVVAPLINGVMGREEGTVTPWTLLVTVGPAVHVTMIPVFCAVAKYYQQSENKRRAELIKEVQREGRRVSLEDMREAGGQTIFFSAKLTLKETIIAGVLGTIIDIVSMILSLLPIDLSNFWFPEPFYLFWRAKLQARHYRIQGAELRLNASMADGYYLWCYEALFNFYSFNLYSMCYGAPANGTATVVFTHHARADRMPQRVNSSRAWFLKKWRCLVCAAGWFCTAKVKGLNYNRWLDQRVDWVGLAPADASNGTSRNDQSKRAYGASGT